MLKIYKIGFWLLVFGIFFTFNYFKTSQSQLINKLEIKANKLENRVNSLQVSNLIFKRNILPFKGKDVISQIESTEILNDKTIAILLDVFKCDKCQEKELIILNDLLRTFSMRGIKIKGITTTRQKDSVIKQRKINKIGFPIYVVADSVFTDIAITTVEFPQVLFIVDNKIISGFLPIPQDEEFSKDYYENILRNTN
jgi:hypothetical protein